MQRVLTYSIRDPCYPKIKSIKYFHRNSFATKGQRVLTDAFKYCKVVSYLGIQHLYQDIPVHSAKGIHKFVKRFRKSLTNAYFTVSFDKHSIIKHFDLPFLRYLTIYTAVANQKLNKDFSQTKRKLIHNCRKLRNIMVAPIDRKDMMHVRRLKDLKFLKIESLGGVFKRSQQIISKQLANKDTQIYISFSSYKVEENLIDYLDNELLSRIWKLGVYDIDLLLNMLSKTNFLKNLECIVDEGMTGRLSSDLAAVSKFGNLKKLRQLETIFQLKNNHSFTTFFKFMKLPSSLVDLSIELRVNRSITLEPDALTSNFKFLENVPKLEKLKLVIKSLISYQNTDLIVADGITETFQLAMIGAGMKYLPKGLKNIAIIIGEQSKMKKNHPNDQQIFSGMLNFKKLERLAFQIPYYADDLIWTDEKISVSSLKLDCYRFLNMMKTVIPENLKELDVRISNRGTSAETFDYPEFYKLLRESTSLTRFNLTCEMKPELWQFLRLIECLGCLSKLSHIDIGVERLVSTSTILSTVRTHLWSHELHTFNMKIKMACIIRKFDKTFCLINNTVQ